MKGEERAATGRNGRMGEGEGVPTPRPFHNQVVDAENSLGVDPIANRTHDMTRLKADLHTHTGEDPLDNLGYSAEMLVDAAARLGVRVLAITCHNEVVYTKRLVEYARRYDLLLVPGTEISVEGKHVLLLNPDQEQCSAATFKQLRTLKGRHEAIVAPHPYYPAPTSLRDALVKHIDLFDAIEYCALHVPGINFNRPAVRVARRYGLPLVGSSDTHELPYSDDTFTWIEAQPTVEGVIEAIRTGRVEVATRPMPLARAARVAGKAAWDRLRKTLPFHKREALPT